MVTLTSKPRSGGTEEQIIKARAEAEKIRRDAFAKLARDTIRTGRQIGTLLVRAWKIKVPKGQLDATMKMAASAAVRQVVRAGYDPYKMIEVSSEILAAINEENRKQSAAQGPSQRRKKKKAAPR